jgi:hypothetical protein
MIRCCCRKCRVVDVDVCNLDVDEALGVRKWKELLNLEDSWATFYSRSPGYGVQTFLQVRLMYPTRTFGFQTINFRV